MDTTLYTAMSAAKQYDTMLQVTSNNLANADTNGYRADQVSFKALYLNAQGVGTIAYPELTAMGVDLSSGSLNYTNNKNDLAAKGESFFSLRAPDGEAYFSKSISYHVDQQGFLVHSDGSFILGEGGGQINVGSSQFEVGGDGTLLTTNGTTVSVLAKLQTNDLSNETALKSPTGRLIGSEDNPPPQSAQTGILVGYLESANVNAVHEMSNLIQIQRDYELSTKVMSTFKTLTAKSNELIAN